MEIYIVDQTQEAKLDQSLEEITAALQEQVSRDFAPLWGTTATLQIAAEQPAGQWTILLLDSCENASAMGFHISDNNVPIARVGIGDALKYRVAPSSVISHELLEMLADPWTNRMITIPTDTRQFVVEVCDAVTENYYQIGNVIVSDFCTPRYFGYTDMGHFDQLGLLSASIPELSPGGMVMYWDGQKWSNTFARTMSGHLSWRVHHTGRNHHRATKGSPA